MLTSSHRCNWHCPIRCHPWRFVDLARRLYFLLPGFGWCRMPEHLAADHLASGRLVPLELAAELQRAPDTLTIYAAHMQNRVLSTAGRWLLDDLQERQGPLKIPPN
ncbi:LysR substrate-binding domain-containing protein [Pseudomonas antarctica]|uniref:LysR substrate-binding domain-containing protein n=1 Tax=Pseudomonas antarctica TaxID=219572 RepID=UPI0022B25911|nr:LysR substrate-binding domain-containing protein [Pseudomonas antarctica]